MENFTSEFYIYDRYHVVQVAASPFKSTQKIYVDGNLVLENKGTLVNHFMFYSIEVEGIPLTISIEDCGLCCEYNIYLDNTSILDGSTLDCRKREAERVLKEGYAPFVRRTIWKAARKTWFFIVIFMLGFIALFGFNSYALCSAIIGYPVGLVVYVSLQYLTYKPIVTKWDKQYQVPHDKENSGGSRL